MAVVHPKVTIAGTDGTGAQQDVLVGADGSLASGGGVASGVADTGNPIKIAGKRNTTLPTFTDGQRGDVQVGPRGAVYVTLTDDGATPFNGLANPTVDGIVMANNNGLLVRAFGYLFNGTTEDRQRGNQDNIVAVASASYTTTQTQADQTNHNARGISVVLDMTVVGTGSVTLEIDGKDPVSGKYYPILTGAAVVTNSTNVYTVYPGAAVTANVSASAPLPRTYRVKVTANNANAATYSVGSALIV